MDFEHSKLFSFVAASIVSVLFHSITFAATYYVGTQGNDANLGTSENEPWKSLWRIQQAPLQPGDTVYLKRDCVWNEQLAISSSGKPGQPVTFTAYGSGALPTISGKDAVNPRPLGIECNQSNIVIDSLKLVGCNSPERGAITIWVYKDFQNITISNCMIADNQGIGIWVAGEKGKNLTGIHIHHNTITNNAGSGILMAKGAEGEISDNLVTKNCQKPLIPWQAGIRIWSADQYDLQIVRNRISDQRFNLEGKGAGCGIHVDETGRDIVIKDNDIFDMDNAGILLENNRGVTVDNNIIANTHTGIFVYRAGHDHTFTHNTIVNSRSQGITLQALHGDGIDMQSEILINNELMTNNTIENNIIQNAKYGLLKLIGGSERTTTISNNTLSPEKPGYIEWANDTLNSLKAFEEKRPNTKTNSALVKFRDETKEDYRVENANAGAKR